MTNSPTARPTAILSSVPCDSHTWNLLYMQLLLTEHGWAVTNLGACVPIELLEQEALERPPSMIVISTVNGHGTQDGVRIIETLRARPKLRDVPVVIGGKLDTQGSVESGLAETLTEAGYDAVFLGDNAIPEFLSFTDRLAHRHAVRSSR